MVDNDVEIWFSELPKPLREELRVGHPGDSRISAEVVDAIPAEHASDGQVPWFQASTTSFGGVSDVSYRAVSPLSGLMERLRERR
jgi:hypothetical protein